MSPEAIDALVAAGVSADQLASAIKAEMAAAEAAKAERKAEEALRRADWTHRLPEREWLPLCRTVLSRDGSSCRYCGNNAGPFHIDHVVPVSRGGLNDLDNLVVACGPCNSSKRDRPLSEWKGRGQWR